MRTTHPTTSTLDLICSLKTAQTLLHGKLQRCLVEYSALTEQALQMKNIEVSDHGSETEEEETKVTIVVFSSWTGSFQPTVRLTLQSRTQTGRHLSNTCGMSDSLRNGSIGSRKKSPRTRVCSRSATHYCRPSLRVFKIILPNYFLTEYTGLSVRTLARVLSLYGSGGATTLDPQEHSHTLVGQCGLCLGQKTQPQAAPSRPKLTPAEVEKYSKKHSRKGREQREWISETTRISPPNRTADPLSQLGIPDPVSPQPPRRQLGSIPKLGRR